MSLRIDAVTGEILGDTDADPPERLARTGNPGPTPIPDPFGPLERTDRQLVLFIGGLGRSGSTLVELLLNELEPMASVGETIHLWERGVAANERCACGRPFDRCPHWSEVGRRAFGGWDQVELDDVIGLRWSVDRTRRLPAVARHHLRRSTRDPLPLPGPTGPADDQARYVEYLRRVLLASAEVHGGPRVLLESSKHLSTAALLALDPALDVRILHLIRDPRGVAHSWTKEVARPETATDADADSAADADAAAGDPVRAGADARQQGPSGLGALMPRYRPSRTALRWVTDNLGFEALARRVPTLRLRYEDLLADPRASLESVLGLCEIDPAEVDFGFLDGRRATVSAPGHSVAGNPLRFGSRDLTLRLDDAWRTELTAGRRRLVTGLTAPLLAAYGYRLDPTEATPGRRRSGGDVG